MMSIYHPNPFSLYIKNNVNELCEYCRWECKQAKIVEIITCPQFEKKEEIKIEKEPNCRLDLDLLLMDK